MLRFALFSAVVVFGLILAVSAKAAEPAAADIAAVKACTDLVAKNAAADPKHHGFDEFEETAGPQGRLAAAAQAAAFAPASCIGALATDCVQAHAESLDDGVYRDCRLREARVWEKRLDIAYRTALAKADKQTAAELRRAEQAWIAWRDAATAQPALAAHGPALGPVNAWRRMTLDAKQAVWMESFADDAER